MEKREKLFGVSTPAPLKAGLFRRGAYFVANRDFLHGEVPVAIVGDTFRELFLLGAGLIEPVEEEGVAVTPLSPVQKLEPIRLQSFYQMMVTERQTLFAVVQNLKMVPTRVVAIWCGEGFAVLAYPDFATLPKFDKSTLAVVRVAERQSQPVEVAG